MPKYKPSKVEGLWEVDDGSGTKQWTIDSRKIVPKTEDFTAGPIRYNKENKGLKKVDPGIPGMKEATYEVDPDFTDQEGKSVAFGTREHELRAAERAGNTYITHAETGESHKLDSEQGQLHHATHKAFQDLGMASPYHIGEQGSTTWDSSQYDPEKEGYASEHGYDPETDIAWENKRAKKKGQQTEYGFKHMLKESRGDGGVFSRWLNSKVLGGHAGSKSGDVTRVPFYWTGHEPEHGEDLVPSGYFTDEDFRKASSQIDKRYPEGHPLRNRTLGPEEYFIEAGSVENENLNRLAVTAQAAQSDSKKKKQKYKTVNVPERARVEEQAAGTQTDNVAAAQAVASTPAAPAKKAAAPAKKAAPADSTGVVKSPMKVVCPTCKQVSGDDVRAFMLKHQGPH